MIYLDNAATTLHKPQCVIDAVVQAMTYMGNCGRGAHEGSLSAARTVFETRQALADFFGCRDANRVIFTANATDALNIALNGLFEAGDHIITTDLEHNSVLRPLYRLQKERGVCVSYVTADKTGSIAYDDFEKLLTTQTKAVITTHASNLTGNLLNIEKIGAFCREHGLIYLVDAAQTAGTIPIDMEKMCVDVLCFSGHKGMMGPQGIGVLMLSDLVDIKPFRVGGSGVKSYEREQPSDYPTRLEAGTLNAHGIAGLLAAVRYIQKQTPQAIHAKELSLATQFYEGIKDLDGVTVYGDFEGDRAPTVALNIRDYGSAEVADALARQYDIAVRSGAHCAPRTHAALGTTEQGAVRFSFGWFNTAEEVTAAIQAIKELAE